MLFLNVKNHRVHKKKKKKKKKIVALFRTNSIIICHTSLNPTLLLYDHI